MTLRARLLALAHGDLACAWRDHQATASMITSRGPARQYVDRCSRCRRVVRFTTKVRM